MNSSATVTYYVESSSAFHPFTVFPNGSIYLRNSVDREIRASYFIKVFFEIGRLIILTDFCIAGRSL